MRRALIPLLVLAVVVLGALALLPGRGPRLAQPSGTSAGPVVSVSVSTAPVIDGKVDAVWNRSAPVEIPVQSGFAGNISVSMRSVHTGDSVFFLLQWPDQDLSQRRIPWVYEGNGKFKLVPAAPPGFNPTNPGNWPKRPEGYAYEDKAAIIWNINNSTKDFNVNGCVVACHPDVDPRPLKYTNAGGELLDLWQWKLVRTDPYGKLDDEYVDNTSDLNVNELAGIKADPGGPAYAMNEKPDKSGPAYVSRDKPTAPPYGIRNEKKRAITRADIARLGKGDEIASVIIGLPGIATKTDRSDVSAKGFYDERQKAWTLEIGRKMATGSKFDVQFDTKGTYHFGIAIFNNAQIEHSYSAGAYQLVFR